MPSALAVRDGCVILFLIDCPIRPIHPEKPTLSSRTLHTWIPKRSQEKGSINSSRFKSASNRLQKIRNQVKLVP